MIRVRLLRLMTILIEFEVLKFDFLVESIVIDNLLQLI